MARFSGQLSSDVRKVTLTARGLKLNLTVNGVSYEWIFSLLNTDFLEEKKTVSTPDGNQGVSSMHIKVGTQKVLPC